MPYRRIGEGLLVVGFVAIAAMIVVAVLAQKEGTALTITAILGFGTSTIGGVLAVLGKLENIAAQQEATHAKLEEISDHVQGQASVGGRERPEGATGRNKGGSPGREADA